MKLFEVIYIDENYSLGIDVFFSEHNHSILYLIKLNRNARISKSIINEESYLTEKSVINS